MRPRAISAPAAWGPKIEALVTFVSGRPGGRGVITNAENIERALRGETGTWIEG
jgi:carbamate kinase